MNNRKNIISLLKRKGYKKMPVFFFMTPPLLKKYLIKLFTFQARTPGLGFGATIATKRVSPYDAESCRKLYDYTLKLDTKFDDYGVAYESGSKECMHLRKFHHPLKNATTIEELKEFPYARYKEGATALGKFLCKLQHMLGMFVLGPLECTIWETAWYIRSMEALMMDMMCEPEMADYLLDRVTENAIIKAKNFAEAGVDAIYLGDDIGMQKTIMFSEETYVRFIKHRQKKVIDEARKINPNVMIFYHSCGYIEPFIPHLIEIGVDVINPIQPECMDIKEIIKKYGDKLSFIGGIGTQTLMPFGTPQQITDYIYDLLDYVGEKGGLIIAPTHVLEPEVSIENINAYIKACRKYKFDR